VPEESMPNRHPAMVAVPVGRGRIVYTASAALLRNDTVRRCAAGASVAFVRALEYLRPPDGRRTIVVFDEFHHGRGARSGSLSAVRRYATGTQSGHSLLHAVVAGLILLVAAAPRPIMPVDDRRIPRRTPLEHADALAHAYESTNATRTATARLVSGVRRRSGFSRGAQSLGDDAFLAQAAGSYPAIVPDVAVVRRALAQPISPKELAAVGEALERIEAALQRPPLASPSTSRTG
jgi:hypothetical protein